VGRSARRFLHGDRQRPNPHRQLERLDDQLHTALAALETVLADPTSEGLARLGDDGDLIVSTASLLIAKLHASGRQSSLAKALHEYGRLVRTIYLRRYVADEELRRRVRRQLNKGESLHGLRRDLFFAHQGHVRRRHLDDQVDQALCLTLVTHAAVLWTTTYLGDALDALRTQGAGVNDEPAAHLTPAQHDHINFYGTYSFDLDAELRREGHHPLRVIAD